MVLKRTIALLACTALVSPLTASWVRAQALDVARTSILRTYLERIPPGSRVRVMLLDGDRLRGTLMLVDGEDLVLRERTRVPEPPIRIPLDRVADVELIQNGNLGKAIAIGAGAGAAAALGVFFVILATID
jgi:hypothetical protein